VHEMPSAEPSFAEAAQAVTPGARKGGHWRNPSAKSAKKNSIKSSLSLRNMVS
jgi:hypothetical protein